MIKAFAPFGYEGVVTTVETDLRRGIPSIDIVGLADSEVKASRERVRAAINNSNLEYPPERILIALSPCDIKKEGAGYDLPIALDVLRAQYNLEVHDDVLVMGELELSGSVRPVKAINAGIQSALLNGIHFAIVPKGYAVNPPKTMRVAEVESLNEAFEVLKAFDKGNYDNFSVADVEDETFKVQFRELDDSDTLDSIKGHSNLKYAMAVAVAGRHSLITWGSAGCGKTMCLQHTPELLPLLTTEEKPSVDRLYSIAGLDGLHKNNYRPFRMPHQTASIEGMCGGGCHCNPGEISLAHNGVLFLDEAAEFRSSVLQMLRVPLETKHITLSRAGRTTVYPANFQLFMTVNPCPCGNYGVKDRICLCSAKSIDLYWKKFSAPLLDRVAIRINANDEDENAKEWSVAELRELIKRAWERQYARQGKLNQELNPQEVENYIELTDEAIDFLRIQGEKYDWTNRKRANILKVARTLVDMDSEERKEITHYDIQDAINLCDNRIGDGEVVMF